MEAPQSRSGASLPLGIGAASGPATPTLHGPTVAGRSAPVAVCSMQDALVPTGTACGDRCRRMPRNHS